jgi:hypothetical protein
VQIYLKIKIDIYNIYFVSQKKNQISPEKIIKGFYLGSKRKQITLWKFVAIIAIEVQFYQIAYIMEILECKNKNFHVS